MRKPQPLSQRSVLSEREAFLHPDHSSDGKPSHDVCEMAQPAAAKRTGDQRPKPGLAKQEHFGGARVTLDGRWAPLNLRGIA